MLIIIFGCIFGALSILFGAFITHSLEGIMTPKEISTLQLASKYLYWGAIPLLILFFSYEKWRWPKLLFTLFIIGTICFSGSLIFYTFTKIKWLVFITPIGGISLICAWIYLLILAIKRNQQLSLDSND